MPELNFSWNSATFKVLGVICSTNIQEIVLLDYENKLVEMRKVLNAQARRHIKPFGNITIKKNKKTGFMKTHAFMNLLEPRKTFSDDLSKLFVSFLWDGGEEKKRLKN